MGERGAPRAARPDPAAPAGLRGRHVPGPKETTAEAFTCGPDNDKHIAQLRQYLDAGVDEVYVQQIGSDMDGFFAAYEKDVLPALR